jgi:putative thiamine transport system substrate-binding protein
MGTDMIERRLLLAISAATPLAGLAGAARAQPTSSWTDILAKARGQTVYWNAWAGDEQTNDFIAWVGAQTRTRYGVAVQHVRLKDTAEAVTKVIAEKAAGRLQGGGVDLIWINGPNFLAMKDQGLLHGPVLPGLPNASLVDTTNKRSNVIDFTTPVDGMAVPWRLAQLVFVYDSARLRPADVPRSAETLLAWARRNPGRLTHPTVANFMGSTFLKQALIDLSSDLGTFQRPATDAGFDAATAPLWAWYDQLRPLLWRQGRQFPENEAAQRQLLNDGEIDITLSFNPSEAAVAAQAGLLPDSVRSFTFAKGMIGNTSFVAIPFNAAHKEGAMVVADFLLEPETQARAQDIRRLGTANVLDTGKLSPEQRRLFEELPGHPALPAPSELGAIHLEPHASWMTRIAAEWSRRTAR